MARQLIALLKSLTKSARNFFRRFGIYRPLFRFWTRFSRIGSIYNRRKKDRHRPDSTRSATISWSPLSGTLEPVAGRSVLGRLRFNPPLICS